MQIENGRLQKQILTGLALIAGSIITYQIYKKITSTHNELPGPNPSNKELGNFGDMSVAGSLHEYLLELNQKYGSIGAFWWGNQRVAYITSQKVMLDKENKKILNKLSTRPPFMFDGFRPLITEHSIQYANGLEFEAKYHKVYLMVFQKNMLSKIPIITDMTQQIMDKWSKSLADEPEVDINFSDDSFEFASKSVFKICFGCNIGESQLSDFITAYKLSWYEMEKRLIDGIPSDADSDAQLQRNLDKMKDTIRCIMKQSEPSKESSFLQCVSEQSDLYDTEEKILGDAMTAVVGG